MQDPRLGVIATLGKITAYRVNGEVVRAEYDEEFTDFGQHYRFPFIPILEFWLDQEAADDETEFYLNHLETEWKLMRGGMKYDQALEIADRKERSMRKMVDGPVGGKQGDHSRARLAVLEYGTDYLVWLVDGRYVRDHFFIDFTEGGHGYVYDFILKNEIWIDDDVEEEERPYVILHEVYERRLMMNGESYSQAHKQASEMEYHARHSNLTESTMNFDSQNLKDEFQAQYNRERQNAAAYEAMAVSLEGLSWDGFAKFMYDSAKDELEHAAKFRAFLIERNTFPKLEALAAPEEGPGSPAQAVAIALRLEEQNTVYINNLSEMAEDVEDHDAYCWLAWALEEQRKSERELIDLYTQMQRLDNTGLFVMDRHLGDGK